MFYLGKLSDANPEPAYPELRRLTERMLRAAPKPRRVVAFPGYNTDNLVCAPHRTSSAGSEFWYNQRNVLGPVIRLCQRNTRDGIVSKRSVDDDVMGKDPIIVAKAMIGLSHILVTVEHLVV